MIMSLDRLSVNQATTETATTRELVAACRSQGIPAIAPWRHQYVGESAELTRELLDSHGVVASSLCRGGFFTNRPAADSFDDNRHAIDEAAALGAPTLVLVCGPVTDTGLVEAEHQILEGIASIVDHAAQAGVALAIEPFHPMFAAERSAVVTLAQATRLVRQLGATNVGLAVDTYHVWWDPNLESSLADAADYVLGIHVADWLVPTTDLLAGRGLPGDGIIDLSAILTTLVKNGYDGWVEVEVLNREVWARPTDAVIADVRERMRLLLGDS